MTEFTLLRVPYRVKWRPRKGPPVKAHVATERGVQVEFEHAATARRYVDEHNAAHPHRCYWIVPP